MTPRPLARGPPLRCSDCGSRRVMAVLPGSEPISEFGIRLSAGTAQACWCLVHWRQHLDRNLPTTRRGRINP